MTWRKRIPEDYIPSGYVAEKVQIVWTDLEKAVMKTCRQTNLTEAQRDMLDKDVFVVEKDMTTANKKSPNDLYHENPIYRAFADNKMALMAANGSSAGKIIKALANYTHPHGWLVYLEEHPSSAPSERSGDYEIGDLPQ